MRAYLEIWMGGKIGSAVVAYTNMACTSWIESHLVTFHLSSGIPTISNVHFAMARKAPWVDTDNQ